MRGVLGIVGLLLTLAIVGVLMKKQTAPLTAGGQPNTGGQVESAEQNSQQIQAQVKQSVEAAMQTPRTIPDDK